MAAKRAASTKAEPFRRALTAIAAGTVAIAVAFVLVQQDIRGAADEPQRWMASDAASRLDRGAAPADVITGPAEDVASSAGPFLVVYDDAGIPLAWSGELAGQAPVPPIGVLDAAWENGENRVTWQPREQLRLAAVVERWDGGTVLAARSLAATEAREDQALALAGFGWVAMAIGTLAAAAIGGRRD